MRNYRKYTNNDIIKIVPNVTSLRQLLKKLELKEAGGNYANMKRKLQELKIDCSHWTGSAWNKNKQLKDWTNYHRPRSFKKHLIKLRGHKCERCQLSEWEKNPIPLEIDHVSGDRTDNRLENLLLLCCNCHALTSTWRGRKRVV